MFEFIFTRATHICVADGAGVNSYVYLAMYVSLQASCLNLFLLGRHTYVSPMGRVLIHAFTLPCIYRCKHRV